MDENMTREQAEAMSTPITEISETEKVETRDAEPTESTPLAAQTAEEVAQEQQEAETLDQAKREELVVNAAREQATNMIQSASEHAQNQRQLENQLYFLEVTGITLLGWFAFNHYKKGMSIDDIKTSIGQDIETEVERLQQLLDSGEMEYRPTSNI